MTYKVDLDIYNGPMDLLLYLVRREEMDIREIPIARIADQYIAYLEILQKLDIELAGDFIVMAATLLELKSRALLPREPQLEEEGQGEDEEDPRDTLIRQLIEYRRFKEAAAMLDDRGRDMARRWPRQFDERLLQQAGAADAEDIGPPAELFSGVEIWDLVGAFAQAIRNLGYAKPGEVIYDDTPIEEVAVQIVARLQADRSLLFTQLFAPSRSIAYCISVFLAILELIRQSRIGVDQPADFKDLRVFLRDPSSEPPPEATTPRGADESADALHRKRPRRPSSRETGGLREIMEDVQFEKTEFDEILDSIKVPDVEAYRPIYSDDELMGREAVKPPASPGDEPATNPAPAPAKPPAPPGDVPATDEPSAAPPPDAAGGDDEGQNPNDESMPKNE